MTPSFFEAGESFRNGFLLMAKLGGVVVRILVQIIKIDDSRLKFKQFQGIIGKEQKKKVKKQKGSLKFILLTSYLKRCFVVIKFK